MAHLLRKPQQGAAAVIVALWMGVALSCLMVLDIGNLFWQQRELQKIADLGAIAGASGDLNGNVCQLGSEWSATQNSKLDTDELTAEVGTWQPVAGSSMVDFFLPTLVPADRNACRVTVVRSVPYFFLWPTHNRLLSATATALQRSKPVVRLGVRSELLSIDSTQSPVLDLLLGGLLGGGLQLGVLGWNGLLNTQLDLLQFLDALALRVGVQAGNYDELLNTQIGLGKLLDVALNVLSRRVGTADASVSALTKVATAGLDVPSLTLKLGDILGVQTGAIASGLQTDLNLFQLVQASIQAAGANQGLGSTAKLDLGLLSVDVSLKVIQPPRWVMGSTNTPPLVARTAQLDLQLNTKLLLGAVELVLDIQAASAQAEVRNFSCNPKSLEVEASTSLVTLNMVLKLLGIELKIPLNLAPRTKHMDFPTPPRLNTPPASDVLTGGKLLTSLIQSIGDVLKANLGVIGVLLGGLVEALLTPLTLLLDAIVDGLLKALGIDLARMVVDVQMDCGYQAELVY